MLGANSFAAFTAVSNAAKLSSVYVPSELSPFVIARASLRAPSNAAVSTITPFFVATLISAVHCGVLPATSHNTKAIFSPASSEYAALRKYFLPAVSANISCTFSLPVPSAFTIQTRSAVGCNISNEPCM